MRAFLFYFAKRRLVDSLSSRIGAFWQYFFCLSRASESVALRHYWNSARFGARAVFRYFYNRYVFSACLQRAVREFPRFFKRTEPLLIFFSL